MDPAPGWFDRSRTVAGPGYDRWLVPPAALAIHLAIGSVYAFSVFDRPLHSLVDGPPEANWSEGMVGWVFSVAIVCLGLSAAVFGLWLERAGPRKAMTAAALCFGGGLLVAALGVESHQFWLVLLGYGVLGGIGLGLGYISPVSTLIKWFPDRPGLATGLAIMGFGGGAMVGAPLARALLDHFKAAGSGTNGVAETFAVLGAGSAAFMLFGAVTVRVPPAAGGAGKSSDGVTPAEAVRTRRFWLLWAILFLNVTAGIGLLEKAASMVQDLFAGRVTAAAAAGFVGLLSLFNMAGRFGWSSLSDRIGRRATYSIFFAAGAALYAALPIAGANGDVALFVLGAGLILTAYGGGFATIPAYLRDHFGTAYVGAIHGRLLTAWSAAGIAGPALINTARKVQLDAGVPSAQTYALPLSVCAGLLALGFVCNVLVGAAGAPTAAKAATAAAATPGQRHWPTLAFRWAVVGVPLGWGVSQTVLKALALFR